MPRKPKRARSEEPLAPVPSEILDQFVRQGPLTPEELDADPSRVLWKLPNGVTDC